MLSDSIIGSVDIGGSHISAGIADRSGLLALTAEKPILVGDADTIPIQVISMLSRLCARRNVPIRKIERVGVSAAGLQVTHGVQRLLVNSSLCGATDPISRQLLNGWNGIPLIGMLEKHFPWVKVENDCISSLTAERYWTANSEVSDLALCNIGSGIGMAFCIDGNILRGARGNGSHAGHQIVSEDVSHRCGCGNLGDVESFAGGIALERLHRTSCDQLFLQAQDDREPGATAIQRSIDMLTRGLFNVISIMDIQKIVFTGGVAHAHASYILPLIREKLDEYPQVFVEGVRIELSSVWPNSGIIAGLTIAGPDDWLSSWKSDNTIERIKMKRSIETY